MSARCMTLGAKRQEVRLGLRRRVPLDVEQIDQLPRCRAMGHVLKVITHADTGRDRD